MLMKRYIDENKSPYYFYGFSFNIVIICLCEHGKKRGNCYRSSYSCHTGKFCSLKVGDILEIQIPTIPTEGYAWQVQDLDTKILTQQGDPEYFKDVSENSAGGTTVLRFKAVGAGKTNISLIYTNAATAGDLALTMKTFGMSVEVTKAD